MTPDIEKYLEYVDAFDLPDDRKIELIHIVWNMMEGFVDRAFGDDPVQLCIAMQSKKATPKFLPVLGSGKSK